MANKQITATDIITAMRKISKYGKSEIALDIYFKTIAKLLRKEEVFRSLALAELLSRLAPVQEIDSWYVAGLLEGTLDISHPNIGQNPRISVALLSKAKINPSIIHAIESYKKINDPRRWSPLITALNYADSHVDAEGHLLTTAECCRENYGNKRCDECMYSRYIYNESGNKERVEKIIEELRAELEKPAAENKGKGDAGSVQKQRRLEEGSEKAAAIATG